MSPWQAGLPGVLYGGRLMRIQGGQQIEAGAPAVGQLVRVRGQQWVVSDVSTSRQPVDELSATRLPGASVVALSSVGDDDLGEELRVVWDVEPGREVLPATAVPGPTDGQFDDPDVLAAMIDAVRWGAVASADVRTLQAPFRAGISIETYQLEPVARALRTPRVNLLIADDVGLGKTIEAGLVAQELLLRHRARRIVVVCPASLTTKWREEMLEKFGLDFVELNADALRQLRRSHGLQSNAFAVHPRVVISLQWLRTPRVQRLLDEVLTPDTRTRGFVDLLIVDEAHHVAPPAPRRSNGYAVDSLQTRAVRRLAEHATHRLFLSATPHNGYSESWQSLLAMIDPQRFFPGIDPDPDALAEVMVRRLKDEVLKPDGSPVFAPRLPPRAIEVVYSDRDREAHRLLQDYLDVRRRRASGRAGDRADDLISLLLKKRLFSSPAAFARTLDAHVACRQRALEAPRSADSGDALPDWLSDALAWDEEQPDDALDEVETDLIDRAEQLTAGDSRTARERAEEDRLLRDLQAWARDNADPADAKALALVEELESVCRPQGEWTDERVIVFTEYRDTQVWLAGILDARGLAGERLGLLYGGLDEDRREHLKAAFQAKPDRHPVRILLATDSASEGIDLQNHCHRVINYDIPFNPNRLEQRIGRVDRHGQRHPVDVAHFVGAGWQDAGSGSLEADLEFLSRVARKVATERQDLGSVNPVLAAGVEAAMLGRPHLIDPIEVAPARNAAAVRAEVALREQVQRLRTQLDESIRDLHVAPVHIHRAVTAGLALADQPPLHGADTPGTYAVPPLRVGWERTVEDLADPLDPDIRRPLTFDPDVASGRDDVVLAHLGHPLVAQATRLLRAAVWGGRTGLHRVTAVRAALPAEVDGLLLATFARLVIVGADGTRLHEEVMLSGRVLPPQARSRRLELDQPRFAGIREVVEAALQPGRVRSASDHTRTRVIDEWPGLEEALGNDVRVRAEERLASLSALLDRRQSEDRTRVEATIARLEGILTTALSQADAGPVQLRIGELEPAEREQVERDRAAWRERLEGLAEERDTELERVDARYAGPRELVFPFALVVCEPEAGL